MADTRSSDLNVYLAGMIGTGKTVLGERLAGRLDRPFVDLDREMDRELGFSFHRLVQERGWLAFREAEYAIVKRFAATPGVVCALGGGTVRYEWNRDALAGTGLVVLLEADLATLAARVRAADRPRVNAGISLEEDLAAIWASSAHLYRAAADLTYRTDGSLTIDEEVNELTALLAPRLRRARRIGTSR
jgi:shikimate kinase